MLSNEQIQTIQNLSNQRDFEDNVKAFLTFGHLFEFNIAVTLAHTYCIQGKPALNADAMAGAVRRYVGKDGKKVCAMIWEEISSDSVTVFALRRDELELCQEFNLEVKPKSWTYTLEDARLRGTLNQRAWKTMPKVMMHKRALTALLRLAFPEIIGTACSPDELAEVLIKDENERDQIVFNTVESERVPSNVPAAVPPPEETKKKTKVKAKAKPKAKKVEEPKAEEQISNNPLRNFHDINSTIEELKKEGADIDSALVAMETYSGKPLNQCWSYELEKLFYEVGVNPIRVMLQNGKIDLSFEGFQSMDKAQLSVLAGLFDVFYGTSFDPNSDKDFVDYCFRVYEMSKEPTWTEAMLMLRKQLNENLIDQKTFNMFEKAITDSPIGGTFFTICKQIGVELGS